MKDATYHLKEQTTGVNDIAEALSLGKNSFRELENLFWFIGKGYEQYPEAHKLLARTGNFLTSQHSSFSEDREASFTEAVDTLNNNPQTTTADRANVVSESLSSLDYIAESMLDIKVIFEAISGNTKKGSNDKRLADSGIYLAEDYANMIDCTLEDLELKCGLNQTKEAA